MKKTKIHAMLTYFTTFLLLFVSTACVMDVGIDVDPTYEVSAEGVGTIYQDFEYDHARILTGQPTFYDNFCNNTALASTGWSNISTPAPEKGQGYMYINTTNVDPHGEWVGRNITELSAATTGMFEVMYISEDKEAGDHVQMNLTLNATWDDNDFDNFAVGNEYDVARVWYKNAAGNTTVDLDAQTFEEDEWYVFQIYYNSNYTQDVEWRWKSNFTLIDSKHVTDANLSYIQNITTVNLSVESRAAETPNYTFEYFYYAATTAIGEASTATTTGYAPAKPEETEHIWKMRKNQEIDVDDYNIEWRNMSGGDNSSTALQQGMDYWDDGKETLPTVMTDITMTDNDSYYSMTDLKHIAGFTPEENESTSHREAYAFGFGDNYEDYILEVLREQFFDDEDQGFTVSYRIDAAYLHFEFSEDFIDKVQDSFTDTMKADNDIDKNLFAEGYTGTSDDMVSAVDDACDDVRADVFGALVLSFDKPSEIVSDSGFLSSYSAEASVWSWGDSVKGAWSGGASFTNAAIGAIVGGSKELVVDLASFIASGFGTAISTALTVFFAGTLGKLSWTVIFVMVFVVIALVYEYKTGEISKCLKQAWTTVKGWVGI